MEISSTSSCRDSLPRRWCTLLGEVRVLCSLLDSERRGKGPDFFDIHFDVRKSKDTSWNLHGKMLYILDILGSTLFSCWKNMGIWSSLGAGFIPIYHGIWCVEWWWSYSPQFQWYQWWAVWGLSLRPFPPAIKHVTWQCEIPEPHGKLHGKLCINRWFFHVKCVSKNGFYLDSNQQKHICKVDAANISATRVLYCRWHSVRFGDFQNWLILTGFNNQWYGR